MQAAFSRGIVSTAQEGYQHGAHGHFPAPFDQHITPQFSQFGMFSGRGVGCSELSGIDIWGGAGYACSDVSAPHEGLWPVAMWIKSEIFQSRMTQAPIDRLTGDYNNPPCCSTQLKATATSNPALHPRPALEKMQTYSIAKEQSHALSCRIHPARLLSNRVKRSGSVGAVARTGQKLRAQGELWIEEQQTWTTFTAYDALVSGWRPSLTFQDRVVLEGL